MLTNIANPVIETYSRLAAEYDKEANSSSCWARASEKAAQAVTLGDKYRLVVDVGCGSGKALATFAPQVSPATHLVGLEPASNMRALARSRTERWHQIQILDGSFEHMPLQSHSVDYLFSIFAFHWVTDLHRAAAEIARVLNPSAEMDLFFVGRHNGREFIQKTSSVFLKYMGPALFVQSTKLRKQLTKDDAFTLFSTYLEAGSLTIEESYDTYYDTLAGHMRWWVRIEGQFVDIPADKRQRCDEEVQRALATLGECRGIPYTIHQLHVKLRDERHNQSS